MDDSVFDRELGEDDLSKIVSDWLLAKYGLRMTDATFTFSGVGVQLMVTSTRAEACSRCEPDLYLRIRGQMDSKVITRPCDVCGLTRSHAFFLAAKSDAMQR